MKGYLNLQTRYITTQKLIIKNAQTKSEIKTNIALNELLKKIPGEQNSYIAGNGHIMSRTNQPPSHHNRAPHSHVRQQSYTQQPFTKQPYTQQPYTQQPYTQQPYTKQPYTQQPQQTYHNFNYQQYPFYPPQYGVPQSQTAPTSSNTPVHPYAQYYQYQAQQPLAPAAPPSAKPTDQSQPGQGQASSQETIRAQQSDSDPASETALNQNQPDPADIQTQADIHSEPMA